MIQPALGFGLGLRPKHYETILRDRPASVDWFELLTEDYLALGGRDTYFAERIREHYPMTFHGVSMSLGSTDPLNWDYLRSLKVLMERLQPAWISDHACWSGVAGVSLHDLIPLPYDDSAVNHLVSRIGAVQEFLGQRILIENVSSYVGYVQSDRTEWEFLTEVSERADCLLLLDVNNIYVNAYNFGFDPQAFINGVPAHRVQEFHIAGHRNKGTVIIDTHDAPVIDPVWAVYQQAVRRLGSVSFLLERDDHIPELPELIQELEHARQCAHDVITERSVEEMEA